MTTRTDRGHGRGERVALAALALGGLVATAGCQTVPDGPRNLGSYKDPTVLQVRFKGRCPVGVTVPPDAKQCPPGKYACVRVKSGDTVRFEADPLRYDANDPDAYNAFVLHFDPFDDTAIESDKGIVEKATRKKKDPSVVLEKPHTFVVAPKNAPVGCEPVDPQIILD